MLSKSSECLLAMNFYSSVKVTMHQNNTKFAVLEGNYLSKFVETKDSKSRKKIRYKSVSLFKDIVADKNILSHFRYVNAQSNILTD